MIVAIVCRESRNSVDGIRDHSLWLADALRERGHVVDVHMRTEAGRWRRHDSADARRGLIAELRGYDLLLLQYNPFLYGRYGFAPHLVAAVWKLRLSTRRPRIALVVHEPAVPLVGVRGIFMGLWQRAQLRALHAAADDVFASISSWATQMSCWRPRRPTTHLPVGSNLPDRRNARAAERDRLGLAEDDVVLATLSTGHPSHLDSLVAATLETLSGASRRTILLALGAGARRPRGPDGMVVHVAGELPPQRLAASLAASDIFLAPLVDGVSTRRTSVMAALQHGLPIVGTQGPLTDDELTSADSALILVPADAPGSFASAVARLAEQPEAREARGRAARRLYEERFAWSVLSGLLLESTHAR